MLIIPINMRRNKEHLCLEKDLKKSLLRHM